MSKIDDLYKRAFGTGDYPYNESGWSQMEQMLDTEMPLKSHSGWGVTSTVVSILSLLVVSISSVFVPPAEKSIHQLASSQVVNPNPSQRSEKLDSPNPISKKSIVNPATSKSVASNIVRKADFDVDIKENVSNISKSVQPEMDEPLHIVEENNNANVHHANSTPTEAISQNEREVLAFSEPRGNMLSIQSGISGNSLPSQAIPEAKEVKETNRATPVSRVVMPSIVQLKPQEIEFASSNLKLLPLSQTYPKHKIKMKTSARLFAEATVGTQKLTNYNSLNVAVNEEIGNVALVNSKNSVRTGGVNLGMKWKGLAINSGLQYHQHSMDYKMFYSHTKSWREMSVESETQLTSVDSTFLNNELGMITKDGKNYFGVVRTNYSYDSVYTTTHDTTYQDRELVSEMDEKLQLDLRYVTLPVQVAYEHQIKRWFVTIGAGLNMSFLANASGRVFNSESGELEYINAREFLNPVLYTAHASAGLGYSLNPNWSILAQPHVLTSLNTAFKESTDYTTQFQGYGINLRLRYSF